MIVPVLSEFCERPGSGVTRAPLRGNRKKIHL